MYRKSRLAMMAALSLAAVVPQVSVAQTVVTPAQCEALLVIGPQQADPAAFSACMPYYGALAQNAAAPGTFGVLRPGAAVTASSSGTGR
ncbi:hypothetical protein [Gymnodinialimonas ulvae]|uniref:hypothetical protein n=1 Tax=Gymnodinialimonas ulvae TaxID=3126504 RepID=UPI00309B0CA2